MSRPPDPLEAVKPVMPLAPWRGGKRNLARRIIEKIEAAPHDCYAEPFCGMAGVFLRRQRRPRSEILNDINGDVVNLFRVVREHAPELMRQFDGALASRAEFRRLIEVPPATLTDVQRAARFVYLQRFSFGGETGAKITQGKFAPSPFQPSSFTVDRMRQAIDAVHRRLQGVHVECLEWDAFIRRYDRPATLFYVDPPYWGFEDDYGKGLFTRDDFARMADLLSGLRGRFVLSLNDRPEVRETFSRFDLEEVRTRWMTYRNRGPGVGELLISGGGAG